MMRTVAMLVVIGTVSALGGCSGSNDAGAGVDDTGGDPAMDASEDVVIATDSSTSVDSGSDIDSSTEASVDAPSDTGVDSADGGPGSEGTLVMGMYNNTAVPPGMETNTPKNYRLIANKWFVGGTLEVHRVFDSDIPTSYASSAGANDPAEGNVSFLSVKPPTIAGVAAGTYDDAIKSLAKSMPAGSYLTMFHEPEENMNGATFVAMFRHFYTVAKGANAKLSIGYVAMAYQWRPGSTTTSTPDDWWPGAAYTDWLGVDAYVAGWEKTAYTLETDPQFQRWYMWAKDKGKPLILPEYGVEAESTGGFTDKVRADTIRKSMIWVAAHPQIKMVMWWNGTSATPGGKDHTLNPTTSQPSDLYPLARAAWNEAITKYGKTGTSF